MKSATRALFFCIVVSINMASAQYVGAQPSWTKPLTQPDSSRVLRSLVRTDSVDHQPTSTWRTFMLAGAVLGGVVVTGLALTRCDQNCQDDGGLAFAPPYIAAGAVAGGLLGLGVGMIVDSARGNVNLRISVPAP